MKKFSRRDFFKVAGGAVIGAATYGLTDNISHSFAQSPVIASTKINNDNYICSKAKVYFSSQINTDSLLKLYNLINEGIYGKTAIKLHTGEKNGPNILPRDMVRVFQQHVPNSNIVETNTLYKGDRYTTESHRETLKINGWDFCPVDIMDENGTVMLPVRNGKHFQEISMGKNIVNYDSMIVLTHFKGHAMGGYGGSMKNIVLMVELVNQWFMAFQLISNLLTGDNGQVKNV